MTQSDRIIRQILHDPWTARVFLAFTVGMFLSCSAEFAAGQESTSRLRAPSVPVQLTETTAAPAGR